MSVVVSTYNRPERLERLLASLRSQTLDASSYEVIVVDNGSSPGTATTLDRERTRPGLTLKTVRHNLTRGPAGGRNSGWTLARAPLVAFIDDDCLADPDWLTAGLQASRLSPGAIIQGRTEPDPQEIAHRGLLSHTVAVDALGPQYEACNIFYPRALLESVSGFDESFGLLPAGEDTDLAWRVIEQGHPAVFAPQALVLHAIEPVGARGMLRIASRWEAVVRVFASHPGARSMLHQGIFWNVWHYLLWRSLLALWMPRWLRRMIITRHLTELRRRARRAGAGSWGVAFLLLHDLVECYAVARGAIRYRTLVL